MYRNDPARKVDARFHILDELRRECLQHYYDWERPAYLDNPEYVQAVKEQWHMYLEVLRDQEFSEYLALKELIGSIPTI